LQILAYLCNQCNQNGPGLRDHKDTTKYTQRRRQQSTTSAASTNKIKSLRQIEAGVGGRDHDGGDWLALSSSWGLIAIESEQEKQELKLKSKGTQRTATINHIRSKHQRNPIASENRDRGPGARPSRWRRLARFELELGFDCS
jgi:hypothetical protein